QIIEGCRDRYEEVLVSCEILDRWHTDRVDQTYTTETGKLFKPDVIAPVEEMCAQPITKLMLLAEERIVRKLDEYIRLHFASEVVTVCTDRELLQVMNLKVSKSAALERICGHYGVRPAEVMAIGDAPNDVGM